MSRRYFLKTGALAAGAAVLHGCSRRRSPAELQSKKAVVADPSKVIQWRLASAWTATFPVFAASVQRIADDVFEMSGGRFQIEVDPSNKHKTPFGVFDLVREGQYQIGQSPAYYWKGKDPVMSLFTTMPFGLTAAEQNGWYWYGGGNALLQKAFARHGMLAFNAGNTDMQMGGWFKREIRSLADMQGLKMRVPGLGGEIYAKIGVQVVNIPGGELYSALEKNVVDAVEWVGPAIDIPMGFQQIAPYYYTGWQEPCAELHVIVNRQSYDELPGDLQAILRLACKAQSLDLTSEMVYKNAIAWEEIQTKYPNVQVRSLPPDVLAELRKQTDVLLGEMAALSPECKEVLDSQRAFLKKSRRWTELTTLEYLKVAHKE